MAQKNKPKLEYVVVVKLPRKKPKEHPFDTRKMADDFESLVRGAYSNQPFSLSRGSRLKPRPEKRKRRPVVRSRVRSHA